MPDLPPAAFWLLAALMVTVALAFVLPRLLSDRSPAFGGGSRRALNLEVYRSQLADLARERDEGALSQADYESALADVERRLVEEPLSEQAAPPHGVPRRAAWIVVAVLPIAAMLLYAVFGTPSALDPATFVPAGADPAAYRASLERHIARHPADARSLVLLARARLDVDQFAQAADAYQRAIDASPKVARDPEVLCELADALGMANGRSLAGRPRTLIDQALAIAPEHPRALEMAGSAAYEAREFAAAAAHWQRLLARLAPDSAQHRELAAAIERARHLARTMPADAGGTAR